MVTRLFPLNVKVSFEDRPYKLGETIDLTVELSPRLDIAVREGRVDLVCEERWTEVSTVMVTAAMSATTPSRVVGEVPKQVTEKHRAAFVHSRVVFLENAQLRSGVAARYNPRLDIDTEPPPHADKATLSWRLKTTVDVAGARDITARRPVKVSLA